jgi:hypothetical protein
MEVEYAMFQIAAGVARERLRIASEEFGNVALVAGPSTLTDPLNPSQPLRLIPLEAH